MNDTTKADQQRSGFNDAYRDGKFSPFKYMLEESWAAAKECDVDFDDWIYDLDLNKPQTALLKRMLIDIDLEVDFWWEDDEHAVGIALSIFVAEPWGTIAQADLFTMFKDAFEDADSSSLESIKKFRDMIVEETAKLEALIATEEVP